MSSDRNTIDIGLKIEADAASAAKTQARVKKIIKNLESLKAAQTDKSVITDIERQIKLYGEEGFAIVRATEEQEALNAEIAKQTKLQEKAAAKSKQTGTREAKFGQASQDVALAGDVESNLRAVGGALSTVGGEAGAAAGQLVGLGAEFPAVIEAAGRLPSALSGFPEAVNKAAKAIGVPGGGAGLVGAMAAAAVVALVLSEVFKELNEEAEAAAEANSEALDAKFDLREAIEEEGLTSAEATEQLNALNRAQERTNEKTIEAKENLEAALTPMAQFIQLAGEFIAMGTPLGLVLKAVDTVAGEDILGNVVSSITDFVGLDKGVGTAKADVEAAETEGKTISAQRQAILDAQEAGAFAANDAAAAAELLTEETEALAIAEEKQAAATKEVAKASNNAAKAEKKRADELAKASKAVTDAENKRVAGMREFIVAAGESGNELAELQQEQTEKLIDFARDAADDELKAQKKFGKDKKKLGDNQQFLALFDLQTTNSEEEQERAAERSKKLAELRADLEAERIEKQMAAQAEEADKFAQLHKEATAVIDAQKKEAQVLRKAENEKVTLVRNRFAQERQAYEQMNQFIGQFANNAKKQMASIVQSSGGGGSAAEQQLKLLENALGQ